MEAGRFRYEGHETPVGQGPPRWLLGLPAFYCDSDTWWFNFKFTPHREMGVSVGPRRGRPRNFGGSGRIDDTCILANFVLTVDHELHLATDPILSHRYTMQYQIIARTNEVLRPTYFYQQQDHHHLLDIILVYHLMQN